MAAEIRPARAKDVDALAAIEEAVFDADRISNRSFRRLIASRSAAVLVSGHEDGVDGYCVVLFRAGSARARLYSIAARKGAHGGVGRALLAAAETAASHRKAASLHLEVREDNARAISLYEKNGYHATGREAGYYEDGATALRYVKALDAGATGTASS